MAFTIEDYHDLVRLLREHPEWREELRSLLLSDELLSLPRTVAELASQVRALAEQVKALAEDQRGMREELRELAARVDSLAEAQRELTARVDSLAEAQRELTARVDSLAEAQRELTARVNALTEAQRELTARVDSLAEAQRRTEESLRELAEAHRELEAAVGKLERRVGGLEDRVGRLTGLALEINYERRAGAYFGALLRRVRVVRVQEIEERLGAALSEEEFREVLRLDLLVRGRLRGAADEPEVWLAVEVSAVVNGHDVERASRRARLLRKAGFAAIPVAAGEEITEDAEDLAKIERVALMHNDLVLFWEEALEEAFPLLSK